MIRMISLASIKNSLKYYFKVFQILRARMKNTSVFTLKVLEFFAIGVMASNVTI